MMNKSLIFLYYHFAITMWHIVQLSSNLSPSQDIANIFGKWSSVFRTVILLGSFAITLQEMSVVTKKISDLGEIDHKLWWFCTKWSCMVMEV
jgi:cadmium resistance protein CadD (predicted permease)